MAHISQNYFHDIDDYLETIKFYLLHWAAAADANLEQMSSKREAAFIQGLSGKTRIFLDLQNISGTNNILQIIQTMESNMKERSQEENYFSKKQIPKF